MDLFHIKGPVRLTGTVDISGSKNAALPIMASTILAPGKSIIRGAPNLADISVPAKLLHTLGAKVKPNEGSKLQIDASVINNPVGHYDIVRKMRASICILGPLLARCGQALSVQWLRTYSYPGGSLGTCFHLLHVEKVNCNEYRLPFLIIPINILWRAFSNLLY
jgi:UDP-N-acetylglucosamine enolpyruvyl transferase